MTEIGFVLGGDHVAYWMGNSVQLCVCITHRSACQRSEEGRNMEGSAQENISRIWQLCYKELWELSYRSWDLASQLVSWWWGWWWMAFISSKPSRTVHGLVKSLSCLFLSSYQGKMNSDNQANWRTSMAYIKGPVKINLTFIQILEEGIRLWRQRLFPPWQNRDSTAQHKTPSRLIPCNPQLEQLILQGVMLLFSGISTESLMRWTCVHYDAFWQLLSPGIENILWFWSVHFGVVKEM